MKISMKISTEISVEIFTGINDVKINCNCIDQVEPNETDSEIKRNLI